MFFSPDYKLDETIKNDDSYLSYCFLYMYRILKAIIKEPGFLNYLVWFADFPDLNRENREYQYEKLINKLNLAEEYCKYDNWHDFAKDNSVEDLKHILRFNRLDDSGDKDEVVLRIIDNNLDLEDEDIYDSRLTPDGEKLFEYLKWIEIYDYLPCYNFEDFHRFCMGKDGSIKEIALNYLDEHLKVANQKKDYSYFHECKKCKRLIELYQSDDLKYTFTDCDDDNYKVFERFVEVIENYRQLKIEEELKRLNELQNISFTQKDFYALAYDKYCIYPKEDDSLIIPITLKRFEFFKMIREYNDVDLALYDLSFTPADIKSKLRRSSFEDGYLTNSACKANWSDFSKDLSQRELKEFLQIHEVNFEGTKKELIKMISKSNLPLEEFTSEKTFLTQKGYDYLKKYNWVQFYIDILHPFDFLEYFKYLADHEGSVEEISLNYLDEHLKIANESLDFKYIMSVYVAKSKILQYMGNLEDALTCDMRILHLNMNPICFDFKVLYQNHIPLNPVNIANLKNLKSEFGIEKILESFNENWNFMEFDSVIIPKDDVWDYLIKALNSNYENFGSKKIKDKFFKPVSESFS